jgi:hypothetical protein
MISAMKTFEQAQYEVQNLPAVEWTLLRKAAVARLEDTTPSGQGIGTSDISCEAISMVQADDYSSPLWGDMEYEAGDCLRTLINTAIDKFKQRHPNEVG